MNDNKRGDADNDDPIVDDEDDFDEDADDEGDYEDDEDAPMAPAAATRSTSAGAGGEPRVSIMELAEAMAAMQLRREGRERPIVGREAIVRAAQGLGVRIQNFDEVDAELRTRRVFTSVQQSPENRNRSGGVNGGGRRGRRKSSRKLEKERRQRVLRLAYASAFALVTVLLAGYTFWQRTPVGAPLPSKNKKNNAAFQPDSSATVRDISGREPVVRTLRQIPDNVRVHMDARQLFKVVPIEDAGGMILNTHPEVSGGEWTVFKQNGAIYLRGYLEVPTDTEVLTTSGARIASAATDSGGQRIGDNPTPINLRVDKIRATIAPGDVAPGGILDRLTLKSVSPDGIRWDK